MIKLNKDETVYYKGLEYTIHKTRGLKTVFIRNKSSGSIQLVNISDLLDKGPESGDVEENHDIPFEAFSESQQKKAEWRLSLITPFLTELKGNKQALVQVAKSNDLNVSTLYKWIAKYETYGHLSCLVDSEQKGGKAKGRLDSKIEAQLDRIIHDEYLTAAKSIGDTYIAIETQFAELGYKVPHENSVRRRIKRLSAYEKMARRVGPRTAAQKYDPKVGSTPHATAPLSLVQIDHTELDVMLVDEINRKAYKRPWVTLVIDCFSRMVLGFYLSYDSPSAFSTGRAIAHAILPKDKFLKSIGLGDNEWLCWGKMRRLHCDNAKEFRGVMLRESCANYGITLKWRPPRRPEMGGHIERLMGTIKEEIRDLAGTTLVGKEMRAAFKPEKKASLTLNEFEKWFTIWITEVYHKRAHRGIDKMAPADRWLQGINGYAGHPGIGLPEIITNEDKLRMDLLPQYKRTVQRTGVHILNLTYFSGALSKWIDAEEDKARGKVKPKRKFIFKMDPRDISNIFFLDPIEKKYFDISTTLNIKPSRISIWDYRIVLSKLREDRKPISQSSILAGYKRMKEIEDQSKKKTKNSKKRDERELRMKNEEPLKAQKSEQKTFPPTIFKNQNLDILPYEELEYSNSKRSFK